MDSGLAVALKDVGRVDVLVNNAGYSQAGSVEMMSMEQMKAQLETNLSLGRSSFVFVLGVGKAEDVILDCLAICGFSLSSHCHSSFNQISCVANHIPKKILR